ncbi:MAG: hypothetical protein AAGA22_04750 [Pseudomonadota bacterium]
MTPEYAELLDKTVDSPKLASDLDQVGFEPVSAPLKQAKVMTLCGLECKLEREIDGDQVTYWAHVPQFKSEKTSDPRITFEWYSENYSSRSAYYSAAIEHQQAAYDAAMRWAEHTAKQQVLLAATFEAYVQTHLTVTDPGAEVYRQLAETVVGIEWETPPSDDSEGLIDGLYVNDGSYTVDITEAIEAGGELPERSDRCWIYRSHAHTNDAEIHVECTVELVISPEFTNGRWLVVYAVREVA